MTAYMLFISNDQLFTNTSASTSTTVVTMVDKQVRIRYAAVQTPLYIPGLPPPTPMCPSSTPSQKSFIDVDLDK